MVKHKLGGYNLVELTTVNKALLERQPKPLNYFDHQFFLFNVAKFQFACFNFDAFVLQVSRF